MVVSLLYLFFLGYGIYSLCNVSLMSPWGLIVCVPLFHKCVLILSIYLSLFGCIYHVYLTNLRLQYEGTLKYLGECHRLEIWVMEMQQGSCIVEENSRWGCQHRCRQISVIPLHMHSTLPT